MTGAAFATFAAFHEGAVTVIPALDEVSHAQGVARRFCPDCGSALTARFDYLAGQIYVPVGVLNEAHELQPELHCHADAMLSWLQLNDGLPREDGTARATLDGKAR